jgi:hypothetical protein
LVVLAFKEFAKRHKDAVLVTQWSSPWPEFAKSVNESGLAKPIRVKSVDFQADWLKDNGIPPEQFYILPMVPNYRMGEVIREVDVALFPNRCEGGTNLVAMECIASGIPTICSANTGHIDLIREQWAIPLKHQKPIQRLGGSEGWGESCVEEIVEVLELHYRFRTHDPYTVNVESGFMSSVWTWEDQIKQLHRALIRA